MKKFFNVKTVSLILAVVLLVGGAVGGTLAWIIDTKTVTNTFTYGDIEIKLDEAKTNVDGQPVDNGGNVVDLDKAERIETGNKYEMIPGSTYTKDPTVTVKGGSEACWLFVEITEANNAGTFLDYSVDEGNDKWIKLQDKVYYREVAASDNAQEFTILTNNEIKVYDTVGKDDFKALNGAIPELSFTAYAVQRANIDTVAEAWAAAKPATNP